MKNRRRCTLNYTFARYYSVLRKIDSAGYARRPLRRNCWLRGNNVRNGILNSKSCSHNDNIICTRHRVFSPHTLYAYLLYIVCVYIYIYGNEKQKTKSTYTGRGEYTLSWLRRRHGRWNERKSKKYGKSIFTGFNIYEWAGVFNARAFKKEKKQLVIVRTAWDCRRTTTTTHAGVVRKTISRESCDDLAGGSLLGPMCLNRRFLLY